DVPAMAEAALGLGGLWVREQRTLTGAVQLEARLQHVLPLLDDGSPLALRVRAPGRHTACQKMPPAPASGAPTG
ncbi:MAG TPA: hypothetical protein VGR98_20400, partial [Streptosporangiaceae bacterium]|nr:hypothetical protein [Streptosporangiaceae bacterium]